MYSYKMTSSIGAEVGVKFIERKFSSDYFNITKVDEFDVKLQIEKSEALGVFKDKPYVFSTTLYSEYQLLPRTMHLFLSR